MNKYPEHEKLLKVREESQAIGHFLEGLREMGLRLGEYRPNWVDLGREAALELGMGEWIDGWFYFRANHRSPLKVYDVRRIVGEGQVIASRLPGFSHRLVSVRNEGEARDRIGSAVEEEGYPSPDHKVFVESMRSVEDILAEYFGIDQRKLEEEKRAMLEGLRTGSNI